MSRGLGGPLTLSVLAHSFAVATIGVVGAAWLTGPSPVPPPAALYVDLVHPVVATGERLEGADASAAGARMGQSGTGSGRVARVPSRDAPPRDTPPSAPAVTPPTPALTPPAWTIAPAAPTVTPPAPAGTLPGAASAASEVPRPPSAPSPPTMIDTGSASPPPAPAPARPAPAPPPPAWAPPVSLAPPMVLPPPETVPQGPATGTGQSGPRTKGATTEGLAAASAIPTGDPVAGRDAPLGSAIPGSRGSMDPGSEVRRETGLGGRVEPGGAAGPGGAPAPPPAGGGHLARLSPDGGQAGSAAAGGVPLEYESYVRALRQRVQDRLVYPWTAVRSGQHGVVELEVRLGSDGRLAAVEVVAGTSVSTLRVAAVSAVRAAAPFPFPPGLPPRPLVIRLPVEFRLR